MIASLSGSQICPLLPACTLSPGFLLRPPRLFPFPAFYPFILLLPQRDFEKQMWSYLGLKIPSIFPGSREGSGYSPNDFTQWHMGLFFLSFPASVRTLPTPIHIHLTLSNTLQSLEFSNTDPLSTFAYAYSLICQLPMEPAKLFTPTADVGHLPDYALPGLQKGVILLFAPRFTISLSTTLAIKPLL